MNKQNSIKVLDKIVAVNLNFNIWSAKTKLRPEDFSHAELPPGNLAYSDQRRFVTLNSYESSVR